MDNYSIEYPDMEDNSSNDQCSPLPRLKPSKQLNGTVDMERTINNRNRSMKRSFGISEDGSKSGTQSPVKVGISKFFLSKRSGSTYESQFSSIKSRSKSKAIEEKNISRFPNKSKVKELARYYSLKQRFENENINKTFDGVKNLTMPKNIDIASTIYKNPVSFLKSNFDRPKVTPLQNTLNGSLFTNMHLHNEQRKWTKFKLWAGIKIPVNSNGTFNKHKDSINHWDECRDGVFHEL